MSTLKYQLQGLMKRNADGSFATKAERHKILSQAATQLKEGGYKLPNPNSLKPKHVEYLVERWKSEKLSPSTIKNRMAHVRWWAEKIGKSSMLPKSNSGSNHAIKLDIEKRCYVPTESKAKDLDLEKLAKVGNSNVKLSLKLQKEFGLRRAEAIKFRPSYAIRGDKLVLKASWCKGGRARELPIRTESQREVLREVQQAAGNGSLIPNDKTYIQQLRSYERETSNVGLDKMHGLRHMYAQERYHELAGWKCPLAGGPTSKELSPEEKAIDRDVRNLITEELGHTREQITVQYIGR
ncbi:phage integrase N-terminal domain-containing protein [Pseudoalteromonas sp. Of11M-6]|uniref:phage integrase N-terminal domain-containing protein n=1 Tax=Pseudoalteromonas sp. Of11M-6 TaxID=2917754 RepID=UPI001EF43F34|nr:phage integrase N-terminal domain-containing protein [Pseudoalteromonas sp. Of11M-6]MCG7556265.1 integrase domain-containing protein [Pseudoalteromonas sp. Of11M-6]